MSIDKRTGRIQASAEEGRKDRAAQIRFEDERERLRLQREREKLLFEGERKQTREAAKQRRKIQRQQARRELARRIDALLPTFGRRAMITGPILAPMTVAWIGQIGFATHTLKWPLLGGLVFAAAWELTTAFAGWMYHEARKAGDRGLLFRVATWLFASSAGAMNYWHALGTNHSIWHPTPKAVSYGTMSLVGIGLWELYSSLIHRKHLRANGKVPAPRPRFGVLLWLRYWRITWWAWSLSVRYGIRTVDAAWSAAVAEVERRDRVKAAEKFRKRLARDKRPDVRVTVVRVVDHTIGQPEPALRIYRIDHPEVHWGLPSGSERPALNGSRTGPGVGSGTGPTNRSETKTSGGSETGPESRSRTEVPDNDGPGSANGSETNDRDQTQTGPKRRSRKRSKTSPKAKVSDRIAEAIAVDQAHMDEHGRHISAENLARALRIGKPAALDLVKQVRGGHIDIAK